jgi:hypothetical protein
MSFPFDEQDYGRAARSRLKDVHENFRWYISEVVGEDEATAIKLTGAVFREAKRGPNKGKLSIIVKDTQRVAVVSRADVEAYKKEQGE